MSNGASQTSSGSDKNTNEEKTEWVRKTILYFAQSLKKVALYLHQKDGLEDFFATPLESMEAFHKKHGALTLVVKPFDFFYGGVSVFQGDGQENSITYKLYTAGIRSFTFEKHIMARDLVALSRLLLKTPLELREEDLASRLWREGIPHIAYLQIHSSEQQLDEEGGVGSGDVDQIEQLHAYIKDKFASRDARNQVSFRSFSSSDFDLSSFLGGVKTKRELFEQPRPTSPREIAFIRDVLEHEEKQLVTKGSELLFFLCKNAEHPEELKEAEDTFSLLCEHLFFSFDFEHLFKLFDALEAIAKRSQDRSAHSFLALKRNLFNAFLEEERFTILLDYLENSPALREKERNTLCAFMRLLGPQFHDLLLQKIPVVSAKTRKLFLLTILSSVLNPHTLGLSLLEQFKDVGDFTVDMLHVGRIIPLTFSRTQLESFLQEGTPQVQRLALTIFIEQYPNEMSDMSSGFLKHARSDVVRALFEVLCQQDGAGLTALFTFLQTRRFAQLEFEDQMALYTILGRSQHVEFLDWFEYLLSQKSHWLLPRIEQEKHLAIKGLEAFGSFPAMHVLQRATEHKELHSSKMQNELAHAVTFYHLYIKAQTQRASEEEDAHAR